MHASESGRWCCVSLGCPEAAEPGKGAGGQALAESRIGESAKNGLPEFGREVGGGSFCCCPKVENGCLSGVFEHELLVPAVAFVSVAAKPREMEGQAECGVRKGGEDVVRPWPLFVDMRGPQDEPGYIEGGAPVAVEEESVGHRVQEGGPAEKPAGQPGPALLHLNEVVVVVFPLGVVLALRVGPCSWGASPAQLHCVRVGPPRECSRFGAAPQSGGQPSETQAGGLAKDAQLNRGPITPGDAQTGYAMHLLARGVCRQEIEEELGSPWHPCAWHLAQHLHGPSQPSAPVAPPRAGRWHSSRQVPPDHSGGAPRSPPSSRRFHLMLALPALLRVLGHRDVDRVDGVQPRLPPLRAVRIGRRLPPRRMSRTLKLHKFVWKLDRHQRIVRGRSRRKPEADPCAQLAARGQ